MLGVLAVAGVLLVSQLLAAPHFVPRLTFENPTRYELLVEVSDGHGDGWSPLGTVDRRGPTSVEQVYDVGDVWQFRLSAQSVDSAPSACHGRSSNARAGTCRSRPGSATPCAARDVEPQP